MERTEILSLFKNTPADGTEITVCGWAKNIRDSKNIGFIALSDGGCFKTLQVVLEAGKLANYDEVIHTGLYSSLRVKGKLVLVGLRDMVREVFDMSGFLSLFAVTATLDEGLAKV